MQPPDVIFPIQRLVDALVTEDYHQAVDYSFYPERVTAEQIEQVLLDYPGQITSPPFSAYQDIAVYEYDDGSGAMLEFFLWVDGEPSDLIIRVNTIYSGGQWYYTLWDTYAT